VKRDLMIAHLGEFLKFAVGHRGETVLEQLSQCRQKVVHFLLCDETFPKLGQHLSRLAEVLGILTKKE